MNAFEKFVPLFSRDWKDKYQSVLADEHLITISIHIRKFKNRTLEWDLPFFSEEIMIDRNQSFNRFISVLEAGNPDDIKVRQLEEIPFEHWLNVLGQRITSASLRDENAVPPLKSFLIEACEKPFNSEITIAQRAWEKHVGRLDDPFWGEVKGNNHQKQQTVMKRINFILDHRTWWNVFFHYKHNLVFEVREKAGHGIRWSHDGKRLIGFLEFFMDG